MTNDVISLRFLESVRNCCFFFGMMSFLLFTADVAEKTAEMAMFGFALMFFILALIFEITCLSPVIGAYCKNRKEQKEE